MTKIKIDKGIEIPHRRMLKTRYPVREMEIGDSFLIHDGEAPSKYIGSYSFLFSKMTGFKFMCRKVEGGFRYWRVE